MKNTSVVLLVLTSLPTIRLMINKDLVIATMIDDVPLNGTTIDNGRGYIPASEHAQHETEVGVIPSTLHSHRSFASVTKLKIPVLVSGPTTTS
ncbi:hypothetical protein [Gimesia sp.]|uniref:hypothetical protein n=1 Tax=Gimesia sp. TaxID=2024833 RepID=UPI003A939641